MEFEECRLDVPPAGGTLDREYEHTSEVCKVVARAVSPWVKSEPSLPITPQPITRKHATMALRPCKYGARQSKQDTTS